MSECVGGPLDGRFARTTPRDAPRFRYASGAYALGEDGRYWWHQSPPPATEDEDAPWIELSYPLPP